MLKGEKIFYTIAGVIAAALIIAILFMLVNGKRNANNQVATTQTQATQETEAKAEEEFTKTYQGGVKQNTSSQFAKTKTYNGLEISDIQFVYQNGSSTLLATVKNTSNTATELQAVNIVLLDKNGETIKTLRGTIQDLEPGATTQLNVGTTIDITNVYDFKIEQV